MAGWVSPVQRIRDIALRQIVDSLQGYLGRLGVTDLAFGSGTMTGDGTPTKTGTVTHGLNGTPTSVLVTAANSDFIGSAASPGSSTFTPVLAHRVNTNWSSTQTFYWLALR